MNVGSPSFASDNYAGAHPAVLAAIQDANHSHTPAYGADPVTAHAEQLFRDHFGDHVQTLFTFNGTGANVVSLQAMLRPYENVICAETAHINVDECGAPERFLGSKLVDLPTLEGKLTPELVEAAALGAGDQHHVQPRVISIAQSTELGTLYSLDEIHALASWAHTRDMLLHVDGARLANAAAALDANLDAFSDLGIDVLSFGGTKNGAIGAEAVVFLNPSLGGPSAYIRKQAMQLASKMRFISAQFIALLTDDLWRANATHANSMAQRLSAGVEQLPGVAISYPVQANAVFATLPRDTIGKLQRTHRFYTWDEATNQVRWMTSFDTTEHDIDAFLASLAVAVSHPDHGSAISPPSGRAS
jgi:threonine aldolase